MARQKNLNNTGVIQNALYPDINYDNQLQNESFSNLDYVDRGTHHLPLAMPTQTRNLNYNIHQDPPVDWRNNNAINYRSTYPEGLHQPNMRDISGEVGEYSNGIMTTNAAQKKGNFLKDIFSTAKKFSPVAMVMDKFSDSPQEKFNRGYFTGDNQAGIYDGRVGGNPTTDLFAGKNVSYGFGPGLEVGGQKRIDTINKTLSKWESDKEKYKNQLAKTTLYKRRAMFKRQLDEYNAKLAADRQAAVDAQRATTRAADTRAGAFRDTVQLDPGGGGGPSRGGGTWHGQTAAKERQGVQVAGPGSGKGSYFNQGGRAGYQGGELVTDESMMEATPAGFMQENVEEVQGEPTREELEALAIEIFQLPLEELNEEQLMIVYQAAMQQERMEEAVQEEDVQYAAQGGLAGLL